MALAIVIRPLAAAEWAEFRAFRLGALQATPGVFWTTYEAALARPESYWRDAVAGGAIQQVFGLFDGSRLIGITGVSTHRGDPSGATAILAMSFIQPAYRGRRLSHLLYQVRLDWVRAHHQFRRVVVSHRASNDASRRANQAFGFRYVGREPHTWPDGVTEDEVFYELVIDHDAAGPVRDD